MGHAVFAATWISAFQVTATMKRPPPTSTFDLDNTGYYRCGQYQGTPPVSSPAQVNCDEGSIGRYVYVYLPGTMYLTFCEVSVYGKRKFHGITLTPDKR